MTGQTHAPQHIEREPVDGPGFVPDIVEPSHFTRANPKLLEELRGIPSLTPAVADALDQLGWNLAVPASLLPRRTGSGTVVGQAITLEYHPERSIQHYPERFPRPSRLAHRHLFSYASPGDVAVIDARGTVIVSAMGGLAAEEGLKAGLAGVVVDGAVRDASQLEAIDLSVWSRGLTPITGKWRLEAVTINRPVCCGGVQVKPGDIVAADGSGICFVPSEILDELLEIVRDIVAHESRGW